MKRLLVVAIALVAVALCAAVVLNSRSTPVPASCPQRWGGDDAGGWVPATADVDGVGESLVPGRPVAAMICAYPGENTHPGGERLAGSRALAGEAEAMAHDLGYLPVSTAPVGGACTEMGGPMTNYLIRFAYANGDALWVGSAEEVNSCVTTTNGTAGSRSYVGRSITTAYRTGTWKLARPDDPCRGSAGRRGQNERMVPDDPLSVVVCRSDPSGGPSPRREYDRRMAESLETTLNSLDTRPSENGCHQVGDMGAGEFRLVFAYADGPPADVRVSAGCVPGIDNGLLQADLDASLRDRVARLAPLD